MLAEARPMRADSFYAQCRQVSQSALRQRPQRSTSKGARPHGAAVRACPRRRGDRVSLLSLLRSLRAAYGTSRTSRDVRLESAKWTKADIDQVAVDKRIA